MLLHQYTYSISIGLCLSGIQLEGKQGQAEAIAYLSKTVNLLWYCSTTNWTFDKNVPSEKQEEATQKKHFNAVLLIFWGCLNNYFTDVVSMVAITPSKRAPCYQWGQQSVLCLHWGDNTLTPNSVNQPSGFLSNGKDSQMKSSMFCMPILCTTLGSQAAHRKQTLKQTELFIQVYTLFGMHVLFWLRDHSLCVMVNH